MRESLNALTLSHKFMAENIKNGDFCIDATAGKGRDTAFLCELVGDTGKVIAFDIQPDAAKKTEEYLCEKSLQKRAKIICDCHSKMGEYVRADTADGIMFNLGWLPDGDHNIFSKPETTLAAFDAALKILKHGGVMTVCVYCGKQNGYAERNAVREYMKNLDSKFYDVFCVDFPNRNGDFPIPYMIKKM